MNISISNYKIVNHTGSLTLFEILINFLINKNTEWIHTTYTNL